MSAVSSVRPVHDRRGTSFMAIAAAALFAVTAAGFSLVIDGKAEHGVTSLSEWRLRGTLAPTELLGRPLPRRSERPRVVKYASL
jgi:hypothetical protein